MYKYLAIKNNYVINAFLWDGVTEYTYPDPECTVIRDETEMIGIGDWYEESEGIFYRPIGKTPPDYPTEI